MAEYYLSKNGGNDSLTGLDIANAWETVGKLNSDVTEPAQGLEPADAVRLDRGSEWEETLNLPTQNDGTQTDPIQLQPYGSGDRPVISGMKKLTGWTLVSGNIYELQDNGFVDSLFLLYNGVPKMKGRLPAIGSAPPNDTLQYISAGTTTLEASNLPNIDYSGGEVVAFVEKNDWIHDKSYISGRSGNVLTVAQASGYTGTRGQYYIENAIEALQADGDWMYSPSAKKYIIYSTVHPDTLDIYVPVRANNVNAVGNYYNTFDNIVFQGSHDIGFLAGSSFYNVFQNLLIRYQANIGMQLSTAKNSEVRNVTFENILNQGAEIINDSDFTVVEENIFRNIGMWLGYSGSGDGKGSALFFRSQLDGGYVCRLNLFEDIGYLGIRFHGDDALVEKNIFRRYCMVKHDGAGIYTYGGAPGASFYSNRIVRRNLLFDGGSRARDAVYSIYIDDNSENVLIEENGIVRTRCAGYYNHNSNNIQFRNNIVYAADMGYFFAQDNLGGVISDNEVTGNVFVITSKNHQAARLISDENNISTFLSLVDNNHYIVCCGQQIVFATRYVSGGKTIYDNLTFAQWQALGHDVNSTVKYLNLPEYTIAAEGANKFPGNSDFESGVTSVSIYHANGTASATHDSTSKINGTGSLKCSIVSASANTTRVELSFRNLGTIEFAKKYVLRFKALAPGGHQSLVIYPRQTGSPYHRLGSEIYAIADDTVREFEFLLSGLSDDDNGAILIEMQAHQGDLFIDDFEFREVAADYTDLESHVKVFYNDQDSTEDIAIPGKWKDVNGTEYTNTISLTGFESIVLEYVSEADPEPVPTTPGGLIVGMRLVSTGDHYGQSVYDSYLRAKANNGILGASLMDIKPVTDRILAFAWDMVNVPMAYKDNVLYSLIGPDLVVSGGGNGSRFDKDGLLETEMPNDRPRFTYASDPALIGKFEGVLIEAEDTALKANSENFTSSPWTIHPRVQVLENQGVSPDGLNNASLQEYVLSESGGYVFTSLQSEIRKYNLSVFVKIGNMPESKQYVIINDFTAPGGGGTFNLGTGNFSTSNPAFENLRIDNLINNWFRISLDYNSPSEMSENFSVMYLAPPTSGVIGEGMYFWGAKFSHNYSTYIKTTSGPVTRPADTLQATGLINTAAPYSLFEIRNGQGILRYVDPGAGTVRTYIDGLYIGEEAVTPSADLILSSQSSDKLLAAAYHSGTLTEQERIARSSLFL
ncbi:right-handed parallel beta-helix repeat-containing protein [Cyclobacterium sp.]|uniref:right-handed parallel beta-helix repeat-containing protein n=1 Tax=Cyclobacterium sp. TaxID=1966343 RepID=UPI0019BD6194|nr:right-handed parallel beta-helix repeat-containing protein [Cyclobacterium sp.]MBD3630504.1 right-handed parallel beta-helix repeat-containing protein [Cyclobacterium sp.]